MYFIALSFQVCDEILQILQERQMHVQMVKIVGTEWVCKSVLAFELIRLRLARNMCSKIPRLSATDRGRAIGRLEAEQSIGNVARHFNVHKTTISRLWNRYNATNSTNNRPKSRKPRVTTAQRDRYIRVLHLRDWRALPTVAASQMPDLRSLSAQTVRNRLREGGLRACRPVFGPVLLPHHGRSRVRWYNNVNIWTLQQWKLVWFSDESRFLLHR